MTQSVTLLIGVYVLCKPNLADPYVGRIMGAKENAMGQEKDELLRQQEAEQKREQEERDQSGVIPPIRPWEHDDS